jgi:hypothetical protein
MAMKLLQISFDNNEDEEHLRETATTRCLCLCAIFMAIGALAQYLVRCTVNQCHLVSFSVTRSFVYSRLKAGSPILAE